MDAIRVVGSRRCSLRSLSLSNERRRGCQLLRLDGPRSAWSWPLTASGVPPGRLPPVNIRAKLGLPDPVRPTEFPLWGRSLPASRAAGSAARAHLIRSRLIGAPGCGSGTDALLDPPVEVRDGPLIQGDRNFLHHALSMTKHPTMAQRRSSCRDCGCENGVVH